MYPASQNGQTYSNNSLPTADELFECVGPFCEFGAERFNQGSRLSNFSLHRQQNRCALFAIHTKPFTLKNSTLCQWSPSSREAELPYVQPQNLSFNIFLYNV